ncbi:hydroxyisourate hydrolase [Pseudomonas sp. NPDC090233]|uniref:hydroxyisourate hydrolase n=1 Tax=Pseudomonas sp. NPDC090233 TaxID=3364479 RepID=UPI00383A8B84
MNGGVSIHVVDVASGRVAQGMGVSIGAVGQASILEGNVDERGLLPLLETLGVCFGVGVYEVRLQVAAFYRARGASIADTPFLDELVYRFGIGDAREHYHLPFKLTAWGVSCFRGGA